MVLFLIETLEVVNLYLGIIGFFLTLWTLWFSARIKKKVDQEFEKADYREYIDKHTGQLEAIRDKLKNKDDLEIDTIKMMTHDLSTNILSKYSFLPFGLKRKLKKLTNTEFDLLTTEDHYFQFRNSLTELINYLEKENKNGVK